MVEAYRISEGQDFLSCLEPERHASLHRLVPEQRQRFLDLVIDPERFGKILHPHLLADRADESFHAAARLEGLV